MEFIIINSQLDGSGYTNSDALILDDISFDYEYGNFANLSYIHEFDIMDNFNIDMNGTESTRDSLYRDNDKDQQLIDHNQDHELKTNHTQGDGYALEEQFDHASNNKQPTNHENQDHVEHYNHENQDHVEHDNHENQDHVEHDNHENQDHVEHDNHENQDNEDHDNHEQNIQHNEHTDSGEYHEPCPNEDSDKHTDDINDEHHSPSNGSHDNYTHGNHGDDDYSNHQKNVEHHDSHASHSNHDSHASHGNHDSHASHGNHDSHSSHGNHDSHASHGNHDTHAHHGDPGNVIAHLAILGTIAACFLFLFITYPCIIIKLYRQGRKIGPAPKPGASILVVSKSQAGSTSQGQKTAVTLMFKDGGVSQGPIR